MKAFWNRLHKIGDILHLPELPNWMCLLLLVVLILRIPSFFEPYYYGDETIYLTVGEAMKQGVTLYSGVHENKPPLLYVLAAVAGNLFWFKVILAAWNIVSIVVFWKLTELIFKQKSVQKVATSIFAFLTTIPLLEGNIVNSELFMIGASVYAFLLLFSEKLTSKKLFLSGLLFGIATLFKVPALFDVPVILFYWLIISPKEWKLHFSRTFLIGLGFALPIAITFVWSVLSGNFSEYLKLAFLQNVGYLSTFRPDTVSEPFLTKNLPLIIRGLIVMAGVGTLFAFRGKLSKKFIFATTWILFALFAATLSERPYPHYLVQAIPSISLLIAMFAVEKSMEQVYVIFPLTLALIAPTYYRFWVYPTAGYYLRFIDFVRTGNKEVYFDKFSINTGRNYKLAEFLSSSSTKEDKVFMWDADSSTVYALARRLPPIRYVADYHINDFSSKEEVAGELTENPPKFIILTSNYPFPELTPLIKMRYLLVQQIENADIYSRIGN
jgi:4-amino-4-deoxy-L-arabinose transferase-like glycosyltransferase